jgi:hypothetical protein
MNPYLEDALFWREVHNRLIVAIANELGTKLRPKYYAAIETRTYIEDESGGILVGIPDAVVFATERSHPLSTPTTSTVTLPSTQPQQIRLPEPIEIKERFLEVRTVKTHKVVTVLELLSPKNKRGDGRSSYLKKRQAILESRSHLVEIDLLRAAQPMPLADVIWVGDYRILVSSAAQRPHAVLYSFGLRDRIPLFFLPLKPEDPALAVDLQPLFHEVYDQGNFDLRVDYDQPVPEPALSDDDQVWVQQITTALGA